jgi:hypothetical protein
MYEYWKLILIGSFIYMAKKFRRMRTFARTASKSMEKKLVDNAKKIMDDPYIILPEYGDNYSKKYFGKIRKSIDKVDRFKEDVDKLEKLSNKRDLSGAIAGTMLIAHSNKAPYLAVAKYPTGEITYAQRGKADKEKLVSVQHFDNPILRLLGTKDIALKKNIHVYSWDDGFISTGNNPKPPRDFVSFVIDKADLKLKNGVAVCGHLNAEKVRKKETFNENYLRIHWKSADIIIGVCESCSKSRKNTLFSISKYLIETNISDDFLVEVVGQAIKGAESEQETKNLNKYLSGELSDYNFIKTNMDERHQAIKESDEKIFVLNGKSYGNNADEFINALKPNSHEKKGLEIILEEVDEAVVFDDVTPNKVLEKYWSEHGLETINEIIDDEDMADKFYSLDDSPSEILELVFDYQKRQKILSQLPSYDSLPPLAKFTDHVARTYKTFGEKKALAEIKKRPDNPKGKSVAYAFLLVFGKAKDKKWQFSQVEIEYGDFLKDYVKKLIDSKPENYNKCLQDLLTASGSSEKI